MKLRYFTLTLIILLCSASASAQEQTAKPRKYRTTVSADMYATSEEDARFIGKIPANRILEALAETDPNQPGGSVQVAFKKKIGWVPKDQLARYMGVPAPDLFCHSNGYRIVDLVYKYEFRCHNNGTRSYDDNVNLRLFDKDGKVIYKNTWKMFVIWDESRSFVIEMFIEAKQYEFILKDGYIKSAIKEN